jgi:hypothetical protein
MVNINFNFTCLKNCRTKKFNYNGKLPTSSQTIAIWWIYVGNYILRYPFTWEGGHIQCPESSRNKLSIGYIYVHNKLVQSHSFSFHDKLLRFCHAILFCPNHPRVSYLPLCDTPTAKCPCVSILVWHILVSILGQQLKSCFLRWRSFSDSANSGEWSGSECGASKAPYRSSCKVMLGVKLMTDETITKRQRIRLWQNMTLEYRKKGLWQNISAKIQKDRTLTGQWLEYTEAMEQANRFNSTSHNRINHRRLQFWRMWRIKRMVSPLVDGDNMTKTNDSINWGRRARAIATKRACNHHWVKEQNRARGRKNWR